MVVVVRKHIAYSLVQHREQTGKSSQFGVVHDMLQSLSMFQTFCHDCIRSKVRLQNGCTLPLNLLSTHHQLISSNVRSIANQSTALQLLFNQSIFQGLSVSPSCS